MRREFHIGAREVLHELPAWEIDVLCEQWNAEQRERERQATRAQRR